MTASVSYAVQLPAWPHNKTQWSQIRITQDYGCRGKGDLRKGLDDSCVKTEESHTGLDFGAPKDTNGNAFSDDTHLTIKPILAGKVVDYCSYAAEGDANLSCSHGLGNWVMQSTGNAMCPYAFYAHLQWNRISQKVKDSKTLRFNLSESDIIGYMGESGGVDRHLHFECKTSPVISSPDGKDDAPVGGNINFAYTNDHPSNHGYRDPFLTLTTPTRKLLFVKTSTAPIYRGPGTKYSVFAKATKDKGFIAFASVYADGKTWYRIPLLCSSVSSCAGWIAYDTVNVYNVPTSNFPYVLTLTGTTGTHEIYAYAQPISSSKSDPFKGSGGIGQEYLYLAHSSTQTSSCSCWYAVVKPQFVDSPSEFAWVCGGDNTHGDWTNPVCSQTPLNGPNQTPLKFGTATLASMNISSDQLPTDVGGNPEGGDVPPPPPDPVPPPPNIPPGASLTVTTRDSPLQMETVVQGTLTGEASHTANVWLEYGTSAASAVETAHRSVSAGTFTETFDIPVLSCGTKIVYRGVAEFSNTSLISYGTWKEVSSLACPTPPSTVAFSLTITPTCPEGTFINERISWEDQQAAQYQLYIDSVLGGTQVSPLAHEIYKVTMGTTHTFQVKAYFSNGTSLLSKTVTYTLEANPCTSPVFPSLEMPVLDASDTLMADFLNPTYIQKLGGSATTLEPNIRLRLYTPSWGDTGSLESKRLPFNPALPLVMERRVTLAHMDKAVCYITPVSPIASSANYGVVHMVKAARTECGSSASPFSTFLGGTCSPEHRAVIHIGTPFMELFLFEPLTGRAYIFINGTV